MSYPLYLILIVVLFVVNAFSAHTTHANWTPAALQIAQQNFSRFPGPEARPEETGFLATLWGGVYRQALLGGHASGYTRMLELPTRFLQPVPVHLSVHQLKGPGGTFERQTAPLLVFIPGIFSTPGEITGQLTVKWFGKMGYHVLVLPNPWSSAYQNAEPVSRKGSPVDQGEFVLEATRNAIKNFIGEGYVTEVQIVGESLGAFNAAVAYGLDSQSKRPLFKGGSFFWPPVDISTSIRTLDQYIAKTRDRYDSDCIGLTSWLPFGAKIINGSILTSFTQREAECAGPIVVQASFQKQLLETADRILKDPHAPPTIRQRYHGQQWRPRFSFSQFITDMSPNYRTSLEKNRAQNRLDHWLSMARARGGFRVFTSRDDFINANADWRQVSSLRVNKNLIITGWGGHIGLTSSKAFPRFLEAQFGGQR